MKDLDKDRLKQAIQTAHRNQDERSVAYLEQQHFNLSCRKGCFSCCLALVVLGLGEAAYLRERLESSVLSRVEQTGQECLKRIAKEKNTPDFATRYFLEANHCPVLTKEGACSAHDARPLACRGVLTNFDAGNCAPGAVPALKGQAKSTYQAALTAQHGPEHYLKRPWQLSQRQAQKLWEIEQQQRGFTVIGEMASLIYLLGLPAFVEVLEGGQKSTETYLKHLRVLGGEWGFWVG